MDKFLGIIKEEQAKIKAYGEAMNEETRNNKK